MKNFLGYVVIGMVRLMSLASLAGAQRLGRFMGWLLWLRRTRSREVARINLSLCYPELSREERNDMVKETLLQNGMTGAEMGPMWGYSQQHLFGLIHKVHNEHWLDEALAKDSGTLIMVPHLGNWEIISTYAAKKCNVTAMYRPAKMTSFNNWMVKRREAVGARMVPTTGNGVRTLFSILKEGGVVGFLPDQEPKRQYGVMAPFMGVETLTADLPHQMIKESGCTVVYAFAKRLPNAKGFDIHIIKPSDTQYSDDPVVAAAALNETVAKCIEQCPAQYQWTYKRFKRRPEGEDNPYIAAKVP
ncbi:MAG: lysophospholipid acyltransferase family protein [Oleibacter sp.]|nr:lysophospholipid acyltransferase family protein [Thalassolituus sp.]